MQRDQSDNALGIARAFVSARRDKAGLTDYPGTIPADIAQAYAVQDAAIRLHGEPVAGWKVGRISPPLDGVDRLAGPIFRSHVVVEAGTPPAMPIFAEGFAAAEAEFLLRIGTAPDPAKRSYGLADAVALIDAVHVGIEVASSPFIGINDHGPLVTISDFGNNNGLVIGPAIPDWRTLDLNAIDVELSIDGERIGHATAETMLDGPLGAARFLFEALAARGIALQPGQWISSGAVTGVHRCRVGDTIEARFDGRLVTRCTIAAA